MRNVPGKEISRHDLSRVRATARGEGPLNTLERLVLSGLGQPGNLALLRSVELTPGTAFEMSFAPATRKYRGRTAAMARGRRFVLDQAGRRVAARAIQPSGGRGPLTEPDIFRRLQDDIARIRDELDSIVYTDDVQDRVIAILRRVAEYGRNLREVDALLGWVFDGLQVPKDEWFHSRTYYDALLDGFDPDKANDVRRLRDMTERYRGRESTATRELAAKDERERAEINEAALRLGAVETASLHYLPHTPQTDFLVRRLINRLQEIPPERQTREERSWAILLRDHGPEVLLQRVHWTSEYERIEERKATLRAVATPLLEYALWETGLRLFGFAVEAVFARLAEHAGAEAVATLAASGGGEIGATGTEVARLAEAAEGGEMITRPGYKFRVVRLNRETGQALAVGQDLATREWVTIEMNVDTGLGTATRSTGDVIPIENGRLASQRPQLTGGTVAEGEAVSTPRPTESTPSAPKALPARTSDERFLGKLLEQLAGEESHEATISAILNERNSLTRIAVHIKRQGQMAGATVEVVVAEANGERFLVAGINSSARWTTEQLTELNRLNIEVAPQLKGLARNQPHAEENIVSFLEGRNAKPVRWSNAPVGAGKTHSDVCSVCRALIRQAGGVIEGGMHGVY